MNEIISTENETKLAVLASEINIIKRRAEQTVIMAAIEIGERLTEAKAAVPAGTWGSWLEKNVDFSERKAQDMMRLYQEYGQNQTKLFGETIKEEKLRSLSYTQAVALLSIKDSDERAAYINENNVEDMSVRELQDAIKARRDAEQEAETAKNQLIVNENRISELETALSDRNTEKEKLQAEKDKLEKKLQKAQNIASGAASSHEAVKKHIAEVESELKETQEKLFAAEEKLKEPPVVYETPQEVKDELERLRQEVAKPQAAADEVKVKFLLYAQQLGDTLQKISALVVAIPEADKQEKYRGKLRDMLAVISNKI